MGAGVVWVRGHGLGRVVGGGWIAAVVGVIAPQPQPQLGSAYAPCYWAGWCDNRDDGDGREEEKGRN